MAPPVPAIGTDTPLSISILIRMWKSLPALVLVATAIVTHVHSQEPAAWGEELTFHTLSIAAIDPETAEVSP